VGKAEIDAIYEQNDAHADEDRKTFERRVREFLK